MDLGQAFRIANLAVGGLMVFGGIVQFFDLTLQHVILGIYIIVFGAATAMLEFPTHLPISRYASFMFSFIGRGAFYIFTGSILYHKAWYSWIPGSLIVLVGLGYVGLEFVPSIELPDNMREGEYDGLSEAV